MGTLGGVGVLDKAFSLVDALEPGPLTLAGLVEATGVPRATAHRLAVALEAHGVVARLEDGRFTLGPRLRAPGLVDLAGPALEELRRATGESVQLYVRAGEGRRCIAARESPHGLRTIVAVGSVLPLEVGSAGRVLSRSGPVEGWIESVEERQRGVASVSAPVAGPGGAVVAAVSVSGPVERTTRRPGARYGDAVVAAARAVAAALRAAPGASGGRPASAQGDDLDPLAPGG